MFQDDLPDSAFTEQICTSESPLKVAPVETENYQCNKCGFLLNINEVLKNLDRETLENEILQMNSPFLTCEDSVGTEILEVSFPCAKCDEPIEFKVEVDAENVWDDKWESDTSNVLGFSCREFRIVLTQSTNTNTHEIKCKNEHEKHNFEAEGGLLENAAEVQMDIVAKTHMNGGYCIMALDGTNRFRRPIYRTETDACCWPIFFNFKVGQRYRFTVLKQPEAIVNLPTPFPHRNEDIVVDSRVEIIKLTYRSELYNRLLNKAESRIEDIFRPLYNKKYVVENTKCRSVGVLKCPERSLRLETNQSGKRRLIIPIPEGSTYDLPFTGYEYDFPNLLSNDMALVRLGLGRPFDGNGHYHPRRCYILALNIFTRRSVSMDSTPYSPFYSSMSMGLIPPNLTSTQTSHYDIFLIAILIFIVAIGLVPGLIK